MKKTDDLVKQLEALADNNTSISTLVGSRESSGTMREAAARIREQAQDIARLKEWAEGGCGIAWYMNRTKNAEDSEAEARTKIAEQLIEIARLNDGWCVANHSTFNETERGRRAEAERDEFQRLLGRATSERDVLKALLFDIRAEGRLTGSIAVRLIKAMEKKP